MKKPLFVPLLLSLAVLPALLAPVAHALQLPLDAPPIFSATYWWRANGATQINGPAPQDAFLRVEQADLYDAQYDQTLFVYQIQNLAYRPVGGINGLSGFHILDIAPIGFEYLAAPFDGVMQRMWQELDGPASQFSPEWQATWGREPLSPDTQGLYPAHQGPAGASSFGAFAFAVNGLATVGNVAASVNSWGVNQEVGAGGTPVDFRFGVVSGPVGVVPEPGTVLCVGLGLVGLLLLRRRGA